MIAPAAPGTPLDASVHETLLAAILRRDAGLMRRHVAVRADVLCAAAERHGVLALVSEAIEDLDVAPASWRRALVSRSQELAAIDIVTESEFLALVDDLEPVHPPVLLMKGAQLAYSLYQRPDLRPRIDTDLLVSPGARPAVERVLARRGYAPIREQQAGDLLRYQTTYAKWSGSCRHTVDLHWRALDPQAFARVLRYEDAVRVARPIPRLGAHVRGLHPAHALLLACLHRVAHHRGGRPLIWLYDIHLLASSFSAADWECFLREVSAQRVAALCAKGLARAARTFGTPWPQSVRRDARLRHAADDVGRGFLEPRSRAAVALADLRALPGWTNRLRLTGQYLFPPARYMRETYAPGSRWPLPALYARRMWRGAWKWLAKPAGS